MAVAAQTMRPAFEWGFLRALARWSAFAALGVGALGTLLTQDLSFVVSFAVAAAIDVVTLLALTSAGRNALDHDGSGAARVPLLVGVRLGLKAVLLLVAAVVPTVSFLGVALGVLVVDTTVLVGGSIAAAVKTFGRPRGGTAGREGTEAGE